MIKEKPHTFLKKVHGIYINYSGTLNEEYIDSSIKSIRKMNYNALSVTGQSIHHINYIFDIDGDIEKVIFGYRKFGIKPEDIDGLFLRKKKEKEGLSSYEQILYGIWCYHYEKGHGVEYNQLATIKKELHKLKCIWSGSKLTNYEHLSTEEKKNMEEECLTMMENILKYENGQ